MSEDIENYVPYSNIHIAKAVDHPPHYNTGQIEVIDFIVDQNLGFHEGNIVKYICRAKHKNNELEDLKKACWYLEHLIRIKQPKN